MNRDVKKALILSEDEDYSVLMQLIFDIIEDSVTYVEPLVVTSPRLNNFLADATEPETIKKFSVYGLIAIIRVPYSLRNVVPSWNIANERIYNELKERNEDADKIMVGLMKVPTLSSLS